MGYARQGKVEPALDWLEKSIEVRDPAIVTVKIEPAFDGLRGHPRYARLLQRMNLTP
jgi:hypothetical protein